MKELSLEHLVEEEEEEEWFDSHQSGMNHLPEQDDDELFDQIMGHLEQIILGLLYHCTLV